MLAHTVMRKFKSSPGLDLSSEPSAMPASVCSSGAEGEEGTMVKPEAGAMIRKFKSSPQLDFSSSEPNAVPPITCSPDDEGRGESTVSAEAAGEARVEDVASVLT